MPVRYTDEARRSSTRGCGAQGGRGRADSHPMLRLLPLFACAFVVQAGPATADGVGSVDVPRARTSMRVEPIRPVPRSVAHDPARAALGARLFSDPRLSGDGTVSCASCHVLAAGGADGRAVSVGIAGRRGTVNAPTVLNAVLNFRLFWDGRAGSLEEQARGPITNPQEMGSSWERVVAQVAADAPLSAAMMSQYGRIDDAAIVDALAHFERTLVTPGAPFDAWLDGDEAVLSPAAVRGYQRFKALGCIACHQGVNVGGSSFQKMGVLGDYFGERGAVLPADLGRFNVTGDPDDRHLFRVPSLRNVELTAPYFHDGSAPTLAAAVVVMAKYQLGRTLSDEDLADIVEFLRSLTAPHAGGSP